MATATIGAPEITKDDLINSILTVAGMNGLGAQPELVAEWRECDSLEALENLDSWKAFCEGLAKTADLHARAVQRAYKVGQQSVFTGGFNKRKRRRLSKTRDSDVEALLKSAKSLGIEITAEETEELRKTVDFESSNLYWELTEQVYQAERKIRDEKMRHPQIRMLALDGFEVWWTLESGYKASRNGAEFIADDPATILREIQEAQDSRPTCSDLRGTKPKKTPMQVIVNVLKKSFTGDVSAADIDEVVAFADPGIVELASMHFQTTGVNLGQALTDWAMAKAAASEDEAQQDACDTSEAEAESESEDEAPAEAEAPEQREPALHVPVPVISGVMKTQAQVLKVLREKGDDVEWIRLENPNGQFVDVPAIAHESCIASLQSYYDGQELKRKAAEAKALSEEAVESTPAPEPEDADDSDDASE